MPGQTLEDIRTVLDTAINHKLCVQTWLGVGNVLFIGFGDNVFPPTPPGQRHPVPHFELQINYGDWWIEKEDVTIVNSQECKKRAQDAAEILVGRKATGWRFTDPIAALEIRFEGGFRLSMAPYSDSDSDMSEKDAWILRVPIYCWFMTWDGRVGKGRRDEYLISH